MPRRAPLGDVWIVARESTAGSIGMLVLRYARGGERPAPVLVRSEADQQNEIRNLRGTRRWVGHCTTVFVPFPSSAGADGGSDAFLASHRSAIDAAIAKMARPKKSRADAAIVEGTLAGRPVSGVLFVRSYPDASEDAMEAAASRVAEIVTTDPASPPDVVCSPPMLERIVHQYESRHFASDYDE